MSRWRAADDERRTLAGVKAALETDRLTIRDWTAGDAPAALEIYGSDDVARWLTPALDKIGDLAAMQAVLHAWIEAQPNLTAPCGRWAVARRDDGEVVGGMVIRLLPPYDVDLEIGWQLKPGAPSTTAPPSCSRSPARTTPGPLRPRSGSAWTGSARPTSTTTSASRSTASAPPS